MPYSPPRVCSFPGCSVAVEGGGRCPAHRRADYTTDRKRRGSRSARGYDERWYRIRRMHLAREPLCRHCGERGRLTPATEVDHILPLRSGGTHADENLQSLCKRCHSRKTRSESLCAEYAQCAESRPRSVSASPRAVDRPAVGVGGLRVFGSASRRPPILCVGDLRRSGATDGAAPRYGMVPFGHEAIRRGPPGGGGGESLRELLQTAATPARVRPQVLT